MSNGIYNGLTNGQGDGLYGNPEVIATAGAEMNYDTNAVTPDLLYDFTQINFYPNSGNTIVDLSGNNNNGVFVSGTNNGTPATVTGMTVGNPSYYLNSTTRSIRLPEFCKFPGRDPFTIVSWVYPISSGGGSYPACFFSAEGRNPAVYGVNSAFDLASATKGFLFYRYEQFTGGAQAVSLYPTYRGTAVVDFNKWYMTVFRYNGTTMNIDVYVDGTRYNASVLSNASVGTTTNWSAFGGLRYNNWFYGRCAYFSVYKRDIGPDQINLLYARTKTKIGI